MNSDKRYGVFAISKTDPNDILGYYVEFSGRMSWSKDRVRMFTSDAYEIFNGHKYKFYWAQEGWNYAKKYAKEGQRKLGGSYRVFMCRLGSKYCPVDVDMNYHTPGYREGNDLDCYNAKFYIRGESKR